MDELFPCPVPWCNIGDVRWHQSHGMWAVYCRCGCSTELHDAKADALLQWNTRAKPTPVSGTDAVEVTQAARNALAEQYDAAGLKNFGPWIRSGQADDSTHTPALKALTLALSAASAAIQSLSRTEELVTALEPFARAAEEWDGEPTSLNVEFCAYDVPCMNPSALVADFRHARDLVASHRGEAS